MDICDDNTIYIRALEQLHLRLRAIQKTRAACVERFSELQNHAGRSSEIAQAERLAEIDGLRQRLQSLAVEEADYTSRIAEIEELERKYQALCEIKKAAIERHATIKSESEKHAVDLLLSRVFSDNCDWDRRNRGELAKLALKPTESSWIFRLQNWLHMQLHRH